MDDDAIDTSENYRDDQFFRVLRKRTSKHYSAAGSGKICSKNKAFELLPVILESKSCRVLETYNPAYIHKCLEKCMGSYKSCSLLSNGNLIVNCCIVQQMTTHFCCTKLTDGVVAVEVTASPRKPIGACKLFQRWLKKKQIHFLTPQNQETKAAIAERMIRTLLSRVWRYFTFKDTNRYVDVLPDFLRSYNVKYHSSIGVKAFYWVGGKNLP